MGKKYISPVMNGKAKKEKTKKGGGGGIGFLIRNDIANIIEECEQNTDPKSETKWIRLKTKQPIIFLRNYISNCADAY